jgi:sugar O-acyltransferase (sialic acid O-acetyltransferase NeuD family)
MTKDRKLIIIGASAFAEVAYEYFAHDSPYEVVAFSVEQPYMNCEEKFGLPIVPFETLENAYKPSEHYFFAANVYSELNRLRARLYRAARAKGFPPASYVSPRAFVWRNVQLGEHCFIFENNVIQPFVKIGDNVILWSGNHIGHHSTIADHCFISSHVVVSGFCEIGTCCFFGVNAAIGNNVRIGNDCLIGAGAVVIKNVEEDTVVKGNASDVTKGISAKRFFKVNQDAA